DVQVQDEDVAEGRAYAEKLREVIERVPGASDVLIEQSRDMPSIAIDVDRVKAAQLGLTQKDALYNLITCFNSSVQLQPMIWLDPKTGNDYFVAGQYRENTIDSIETLKNVPITGTRSRRPVPVRNIAQIARRTSLVEATHYNIQRTIDVFA